MTDYSERLFSYGTLQLPAVQQANFGRLLEGRRDALVGYRLGRIEITDPDVLAESAERFHLIAIATGNETDRVQGVVFEITPAELAVADAYEVDDYTRVATTLASGLKAWVYVKP